MGCCISESFLKQHRGRRALNYPRGRFGGSDGFGVRLVRSLDNDQQNRWGPLVNLHNCNPHLYVRGRPHVWCSVNASRPATENSSASHRLTTGGLVALIRFPPPLLPPGLQSQISPTIHKRHRCQLEASHIVGGIGYHCYRNFSLILLECWTKAFLSYLSLIYQRKSTLLSHQNQLLLIKSIQQWYSYTTVRP